MKIVYLSIAALFLIAFFVFSVVFPWGGRYYLIFASIFFFVLSIVTDYRKRQKTKDILDDEFFDDV